jgi:hypothetical protein
MVNYTQEFAAYLERVEQDTARSAPAAKAQVGTQFSKTTLDKVLYSTATLPLERLIQESTTTDASAVSVTSQVIKKLNEAVGSARPIQKGDKLTLLVVMADGQVKYLDKKVYEVGLAKNSELIAYSDWREKNPKRTLAEVLGLPAGLPISVQVYQHHRAFGEVEVAEEDLNFLTDPNFFGNGNQATQPKPDETSATRIVDRRTKTARFTLDDAANTEESSRPGVVPPAAKSDSTPGSNPVYPAFPREGSRRGTTEIVKLKRAEGFQYAIDQQAAAEEAKKNGTSSRRLRGR